MGHDAGQLNKTGAFNLFLGNAAGKRNTTGRLNTIIGHAAATNNTTGEENTFIGSLSGFANTSGSENIYIGSSSGRDGNNTNSIFIGHISKQVGSDSLDSAIAIGNRAEVACNNCAVIGGTGSNAVNLGIGLTVPEVRLDVNGKVRIRDLPVAPIGAGDPIVVDADGNLYKSTSTSARLKGANNIPKMIGTYLAMQDEIKTQKRLISTLQTKVEELITSVNELTSQVANQE